jgi:hypothetical protein
VTLLRRIERHLRRTGIRPCSFGRSAARDPRLVFDMRRGREPRPVLARRLRTYLDAREAELDALDVVR